MHAYEMGAMLGHVSRSTDVEPNAPGQLLREVIPVEQKPHLCSAIQVRYRMIYLCDFDTSRCRRTMSNAGFCYAWCKHTQLTFGSMRLTSKRPTSLSSSSSMSSEQLGSKPAFHRHYTVHSHQAVHDLLEIIDTLCLHKELQRGMFLSRGTARFYDL